MLKYIIFGVTGGTIGLLYNSINNDKNRLSSKVSCDTSSGKYILSVPSNYLNKDKQIILLLHDIENTLRSIDLVSYVRIVTSIDDLVGLKHSIQENGGTLCDRTIAYRTIQKCKESMKRCYTIMEAYHQNKSTADDTNITLYTPSHHHTTKEKHYSPREIIHIQSVCKKIIYILDSYLKAIISLTSDGRIKS